MVSLIRTYSILGHELGIYIVNDLDLKDKYDCNYIVSQGFFSYFGIENHEWDKLIADLNPHKEKRRFGGIKHVYFNFE